MQSSEDLGFMSWSGTYDIHNNTICLDTEIVLLCEYWNFRAQLESWNSTWWWWNYLRFSAFVLAAVNSVNGWIMRDWLELIILRHSMTFCQSRNDCSTRILELKLEDYFRHPNLGTMKYKRFMENRTIVLCYRPANRKTRSIYSAELTAHDFNWLA